MKTFTCQDCPEVAPSVFASSNSHSCSLFKTSKTVDVHAVKYECLICTCVIEDGNAAVYTCGHLFHFDCVSTWMRHCPQNGCPQCRCASVFQVKSQLMCEEKLYTLVDYPNFEVFQQTIMAEVLTTYPYDFDGEFNTLHDQAVEKLNDTVTHLGNGLPILAYKSIREALCLVDVLDSPFKYGNRFPDFLNLRFACENLHKMMENFLAAYFDKRNELTKQFQDDLIPYFQSYIPDLYYDEKKYKFSRSI